MLVVQCMHDNLLKRHSFCWELQAMWYPSVRIDEKIQVRHDLGRRLYGGQGQNKLEVHIYVMLALQCMHDNLLKMHGFCWVLHAK